MSSAMWTKDYSPFIGWEPAVLGISLLLKQNKKIDALLKKKKNEEYMKVYLGHGE